jgi:mono/diheme cytochrome c family protein
MIKTIALVLFASAGLALADDATSQLPPDSTKTGVTYATDIKPIFDASCIHCHTAGNKPRAHLALDTLPGILKGGEDGPAVIPGNSAKSYLVLSVAHIGDPDGFMPKGKMSKKLTDDQIGLIRAWVDQGAK